MNGSTFVITFKFSGCLYGGLQNLIQRENATRTGLWADYRIEKNTEEEALAVYREIKEFRNILGMCLTEERVIIKE